MIHHFARRLIFSVCAAASLASATTILPGTCRGENTPSCPGGLDTYFGSVGQVQATSRVAINAVSLDGQSTYIGDLVSAAYREQPNSEGHFSNVTFYYQFQANANVPYSLADMDVVPNLVFPNIASQLADVGQRVNGVGLDGFVSAPGDLVSATMFADDSFHINFAASPVGPNGASPIFVVYSQAQYYTLGGIAFVGTVLDDHQNGFRYSGAGALLAPAPAPEPGTVLLFGLGGALCLLGRKRFNSLSRLKNENPSHTE